MKNYVGVLAVYTLTEVFIYSFTIYVIRVTSTILNTTFDKNYFTK
nr:MAG TPA_asm: hypothetical protein [Caudoviricetes sp.]